MIMQRHATRQGVVATIVLSCLLLLTGCQAEPKLDVLFAAQTGEMSQARVRLQKKIGKQVPPRPTDEELEAIYDQRDRDDEVAVDPRSVDRDYVLDRARLLSLMLGDGYNKHAEPVALELNRLLRTQGVNANKQVASILLNEDIKVWKGEPFEQAMAMCWVGMHFAMQGDWDNARTAADNSLFQLRDFGSYQTEDGERRYDTLSLARDMAEEKISDVDEASDNGYQLVDSNFVLGYLLTAISNQQLGRLPEADDNYRKALKYNPALKSLVDQFKVGGYNTVFVVEYGAGPQKQGTGPDNAVATFSRMTPSDQAPVVIQSGAAASASSVIAPVAMDLNNIATDLMWNNFEDVRLAKSVIGQVLVTGGVVATAYGLQNDNLGATLGGLGAMAVGAYMRSQAHVDTRYNEATPQRVYVVPYNITSAEQRLTIGIQGKPGSRLEVTGIQPARAGTAKLHYVRLPSAFFNLPAPWATSGKTYYANEHEPNAGEIPLPYIMGGDCVMPPSDAALRKYQAAGYLKGYTLQDLIDLYRVEELAWETELGGLPGLHVLDGGDSLITPEPGTTGYARLMYQRHPYYLPKTDLLRRAIRELPPLPSRSNDLLYQPPSLSEYE